MMKMKNDWKSATFNLCYTEPPILPYDEGCHRSRRCELLCDCHNEIEYLHGALVRIWRWCTCKDCLKGGQPGTKAS